MASVPIPSSPHLYPQVNTTRPPPPIGLVEEALVRSAYGAKKLLLPARPRPGAVTPDAAATVAAAAAAGTLARSQSHLDMFASSENVAATMAMNDPTLRSSSRASKHAAAATLDRQPTLARSLLHKSSRLLRQRKSTPKLRPTPTVSVWEDDDEPSPLSFQTFLQRTQPHHMPPPIRKESISEPFNFQHVTHTNSSHAKTLQNTQPIFLATEFCAIRAAQRPVRELKGIRADDLPSTVVSEAASMASRPTTPGYERSLQTSKSVDNFRSMLAPAGSSSNALGVVVPPPRKSSRKPVDLAKVFVNLTSPPAIDSPTLPTPVTASTVRSPDSQFATALSTPATEISEASPIEIAQAMTTPDDTACEMAPASQSRLSFVPPEPADEAKTPERTSSGSLRHSKSMPTVKHFSRIWASSTSLASATTTDPTLPSPERPADDMPSSSGSWRRSSMAPKVLHESWEDSVDYCYDYAMDEGPQDDESVYDEVIEGLNLDRYDSTPTGAATPAMTDSLNSSAVSFQGVSTPALPMPSPGLVEVGREVDGAGLYDFSNYASRVTHEETYDQPLGGLELKSSAYTNLFYPPDLSLPLHSGTRSGSPQSSRTPLSKSSSQDSFGSRLHGAGGHHHGYGYSVSGGSTPSLVRGKASSREQLAAFPAVPTTPGTPASVFSPTAALDLSGGASTIPDAIANMRSDLIRAAEEMPDAHFQATISPTLTPPASRLGTRTACPSPEHERPAFNPRYVGEKMAKMELGNASSSSSSMAPRQRQRASSAAHLPPHRTLGHRTSYSLFPGGLKV